MSLTTHILPEEFGPDYLGREDLLALGLEAETVEAVLRLAGADFVESARLPELLDLLNIERGGRRP